MKKQLLFSVVLFAVLVSATTITKAQIVFFVQSPSNLEGAYDFTYADDAGSWGMNIDTLSVIDTVIVMRDNYASVDSLGCGTAVTNNISGNIALIYRGSCEFGYKALQAQNAGARAVIIVNNQPGGPIGMGAGGSGASVTIPTVMISKEDAELLRPSIDAGTLVVFIGQKNGVFANDIGFLRQDVVIPKSYSIPAKISNNFKIPLGAWVRNFGNNTGTNIKLKSEVSFNTTILYYDSSASIPTLIKGDSVWIPLPIFTKPTFANGHYRLIYTVSYDSSDNFANDNVYKTGFYINDSVYSKTRVDTVTSQFLTSGGVRPAATTTAWKWCITLLDSNTSAIKIDGISFRLSTATTDSLTGKALQVLFDRMEDTTFTNITSLGSEFYTYSSNLQNQFVKVNFAQPIVLQNSRTYLACLNFFENNMFVATDQVLDYTTTIAQTNELLFPLFTDQWYGAGFGGDLPPAIIVHINNPCAAIASTTIASTTTSGPAACNGSATVTPSGGISPYSYIWSGGQITATATGLCVGSYNVTVTDSASCKSIKSIGVTALCPAITTSFTTTQPSCGVNDGSVQVTVSGGTTPYKYLWSNGGTTNKIDTVGAGIYYVTITDTAGCVVTKSATLTNPGAPTATASFTKASNDSTCNGGGTATVTGGTPPYSFLWSNGEFTQSADSLCVGVNSVKVTDSSGCVTVKDGFVGSVTSVALYVSNSNINVFPNPSEGKFAISFSAVEDDEYIVSVINVIGQTVFVKKMNISGNYILNVDFSEMNKGVYFMRIRNSSSEQTQKIIIK